MTPEQLAAEFERLSRDATHQAKSLSIGNITGIAYQNGRTWAWAESAKLTRQHLTPSDLTQHPAYAQGRSDMLAEQARTAQTTLIGIVYNWDYATSVELWRTPEQARKACEAIIETHFDKGDAADRQDCLDKLAAIDFTADEGIMLEDGGDCIDIYILVVPD